MIFFRNKRYYNQLITIKCAKCRMKIFKYQKIGKGKIIYCWNSRIQKDYSIREQELVKCNCGNLIGIMVSKGIRMKQKAFIYSGTISNK